MSIWDRSKSWHRSLTRQYLYFTITVISLVLGSAFWVSYSAYKIHTYKMEIDLARDAQKLQIVFDEQLALIENFFKFLGTKIVNEGINIGKIASIIKHHPGNFKNDAFGWHPIYFVDENFNVVVDSIKGAITPLILKKMQEIGFNHCGIHHGNCYSYHLTLIILLRIIFYRLGLAFLAKQKIKQLDTWLLGLIPVNLLMGYYKHKVSVQVLLLLIVMDT